MIEVQHLTKRYGKLLAVDDVSFRIRNGHIYGLLGPNGAGKSTTMNMIAGCLSPTQGKVLINGYDISRHPMEAKRQIGYLPEIPPLFPDMTPYEYLSFVAEVKGVGAEPAIRQINEVVALTGLTDVRGRLIRTLSKGYGQRVGIAQALLGHPDIVILDEPTVGLDPRQITEIRTLIRRLGENKTVIVSSHILSEISELCDHVIILDGGRVVADDDRQALEAGSSRTRTLRMEIKGDKVGILAVLQSINGVESAEAADAATGTGIVAVTVHTGAADLRDAIFFAMAEKRYAVISMEQREQSLEEVFLHLTGEGAADQAGSRDLSGKSKPDGSRAGTPHDPGEGERL